MSSLTPDEPPRLRARERGRARRRLRFLRQFREIQLRDAGGFVFELYRFGEQRDALVRGKLDELIATDKEIRALEALLGQTGHGREIRQPGIGGACPVCGAFHGSDASYCAACGATLGGRAAEPTPAEPVPADSPPEPEGEVTIVRQAGDEVAEPLPEGALPESAPSNGAVSAEDVVQANGHVPTEPDAEDVAPARRHGPES